MNFSCFKPQFIGDLLWQPQQTNTILIKLEEKRTSRVWRQMDSDLIERSDSRAVPLKAALFSCLPNNSFTAVTSSDFLPRPCLKLRPKTAQQKKVNTQHKKVNTNFSWFGTGRLSTNWSNPDFEKEVYKSLLFFFLKSSGDGRWRLTYLHPS